MRPAVRTLCALLLLLLPASTPAAGKFQVFFLADPKYASDSLWLHRIKEWGATGITLRIYRSLVEQQYHQYAWKETDRAIAAIAAAHLDIFLRVSTVFIQPNYLDRYTKDDFHQTKGGEIYYNQNADRPRPMLNLTADRAFSDLVGFFQETVSHTRTVPGAERIKAVLPALSPDDETEFPTTRWGAPGWGWLTGYSRPEQEAFMRFLRLRYNGDPSNDSPAKLDSTWQARFTSISTSQIRIDDYDWEHLRAKYEYYPAGRKDFLDFRASQLKRFIDTCATIAQRGGLRLGVQFGSIYDEGLEFRSTYDVTPLVENAGVLIVDDVAETKPNFDFVSDYERSLGRYWDWRKHRSASHAMLWGTETNWPGYNHIEPATLVRLWKEQLRSARDRGAAVLSVSHWGTEDGIVAWKSGDKQKVYTIAELVRKDSVDAADHDVMNTAYAAWRNELRQTRGSAVKKVKRSTAVHLSCETILYSDETPGARAHNRNIRFEAGRLPTINGESRGTVPLMLFPLNKLAQAKNPYGGGSTYDGKADLVTNYMIIRSPDYLRQYSRFYLTGTSYYMPDSVYMVLAAIPGTKNPAPAGRSLSLSSEASTNAASADTASSGGRERINEYGRKEPASALVRRLRRDPNLSK